MVRSLETSEDVLSIMTANDYANLITELGLAIQDFCDPEENQGEYATLMRLDKLDGGNVFLWVEIVYEVVPLDEKDDMFSIQIKHLVTGGSEEELMGSDIVLDRYIELSKQKGFERKL